jgi:hypothetical protein
MKTAFRVPLFKLVISIIYLYGTTLFTLQSQLCAAIYADSLDIEQGTISFETERINLVLLKSSHTVAGLHPVEAPEFDFSPGEWLNQRKKVGFYHLGDLNFRYRFEGDTSWESISSASARKQVKELKTTDKNELAISDLTGLFPNSTPLDVIRYWEKHNENIVLRFEIKNTSTKIVEIGSLGIPLIFNNNHSKKTLDEAHEENVFYDPYIGMDAGYVQVVRLKGSGPVLLVVPYDETPFEAWNPLLEDPTRRGITFEGFHEWMPLTKAHAENEWREASPWNNPTSLILRPGESKNYGLKFILAHSIRSIEETLIKNNRPVAVGIPGYVLPQDVTAELFLKYNSKVKSLKVEPEGALSLSKQELSKNGWKKYRITANTWGRARLTVTYQNGLRQTINYKIIKPEAQVVADNGQFLLTKQWYSDANDLFNRAPSVITYDYEEQKQVTQDGRAWICGLSDEGGAGAWLNAIMKQLVLPDKKEVAKLEDFVQKTIWGGIQYNSGKKKYGVRKSMFYYEPDSMPENTYSQAINFGSWAAWNKEHAETVERSYNYPHVAAAHWVMYRLARNYQGLVKQASWDWYLLNAYQTAMAMVELAPHYAKFGQMEGSVFILILNDLKSEGLWEYARKLERNMKERALHWSKLNYPFGSEMPWDSTGQEEVYMWSRYFGFDDKAITTLKAILAYMPTIPNWAYNGNARRYWDFLYGGKLKRIERQIHHYGSALNAIPVLYEYKQKPEDFYLLRVGYGGLMGALSNITQDGFAPAAFHSFPSTLKNDGISGDYGPGFYGYAVNSSSYVVEHPEFGWLAFGGNCNADGNEISVKITTAAKSRIFIAPLGLWLTLDAGKINQVSFNENTGKVQIVLDKANEFTPNAYLRIQSFGPSDVEIQMKNFNKNSRGQYVIPLYNEFQKINLN